MPEQKLVERHAVMLQMPIWAEIEALANLVYRMKISKMSKKDVFGKKLRESMG